MEILWRNKKIRKQAEKKVKSNPICKKRLNQLKQAPCYLDIPNSAGAHFLKGDLKNFFAVDFDFPARIICAPIGGEFKNKKFAKETITTIEIIEIKKDYHQK